MTLNQNKRFFRCHVRFAPGEHWRGCMFEECAVIGGPGIQDATMASCKLFNCTFIYDGCGVDHNEFARLMDEGQHRKPITRKRKPRG